MLRGLVVVGSLALLVPPARADDEPPPASGGFYAHTLLGGGVSRGSGAMQLLVSFGYERRTSWRWRLGIALGSIIGGGQRDDAEYDLELGFDVDAGSFALGPRIALGIDDHDDKFVTAGIRARPIDLDYLFLAVDGTYFPASGDNRVIAGVGIASNTLGLTLVALAITGAFALGVSLAAD